MKEEFKNKSENSRLLVSEMKATAYIICIKK